jgi:hypothetical protein
MNLVSLRLSTVARRIVYVAAAVLAVSACTLNLDVNDPSVVLKRAGDGQAGPANTPLPAPFEVVVLDQFGNSLRNITVEWTILTGGGSLSETSNQTVEGGVSSVTYTTGPTAGAAQIQAKVSGIPPVTFSVTIT